MTNCTQEEIMEKLQAPFEEKDIEWRVQRTVMDGKKGIVCAYITNRAIQSRLDDVVGPANWKNEFREWRDKGVLCGISIKFGDEWVTKWDGADETNIESTKGGFSAAMKRTAVQFGIGRFLYEVPEVWVDILDRGDNYINVNGKRGYWNNPKLPSGFLTSSTNNQSQSQIQSERTNNNDQSNSEKLSDQPDDLGALIEEANKLEKCLGLKNNQKVRIFQRVNPNTSITKAIEIYRADRVALNHYIDLIKAPAHIKKHIDNAKVEPKVMLQWLSDTYGEDFKSFISLITYVNQKTVDAVVVKLSQMKAA